MLIILNESIRKLGSAGQVTKVRPGYGRFLLRQEKAVMASPKNLAELEHRLAALQEENTLRLQEAHRLADQVAGKRFVIVRQAGDDGRLFGSVNSRDVAKLMIDAGFDVHYRSVSFSNTIKYVGRYSVNVEFHAEVTSSVVLYVVRSPSDVEKLDELAKQEARKAEADLMAAQEVARVAAEAAEEGVAAEDESPPVDEDGEEPSSGGE